jgi:cation/acetate symporter
VVFVDGAPQFQDQAGGLIGGANMVSIHLAEVVGGDLFLGIMSAVAFATILAVVAGLTLASVSAVSHDIYARVLRRGGTSQREQMLVVRVATLLVGVLVVVLGFAFEGQNIAYLVSLALAVAASTNFPMLILTMYWRGFTTRGAVFGGITGLVTTVVLVVFSPAVWVSVFGFERPVFPSEYPALYAMMAAFFSMWLFSVTDRSARGDHDRNAFRSG